MPEAPSIKEALVARAQAFVDRKYVTRADARQKEMGLAYVEAERQDLAREVASFCASEVARRLATFQPDGERREAIARIWAALKDQCAATKDKDAVKALVMVRENDVRLAILASGFVQDEAGWRTMDTAPKNHFPVLTWSEQGGRCVAFLDVTWTWWPCPATEPLSNKPTHWMPLPAPPIRSARDGGAS